MDRVVRFARELNERLTETEKAIFKARLKDENFTDLMDEGLRQAGRSTSDERRQHIANIIKSSLTPEAISFIESKHLLKILGEINDIEVLVLRSYLYSTIGSDEEFRATHEEALRRIPVHMGSTQSELDKNALHQSYRQHLVRLGLMEERFELDSKTKMPRFDTSTGAPKRQRLVITSLGKLLLRQVGFTE
jgi:hypothetical protein